MDLGEVPPTVVVDSPAPAVAYVPRRRVGDTGGMVLSPESLAGAAQRDHEITRLSSSDFDSSEYPCACRARLTACFWQYTS